MRTKLMTVFLLQASLNTWAASEPPKEHIHFLAEHLAEAVQDARYYAMPWPAGDYSAEGWRPLVSVAGSQVSEGFAIANGQLLSLGVSKNWSNRWSTDFIVFYDRFHVGGSHTENSLLPFNLDGVPLDLPERAIFSSPDGEFTHTGGAVIAAYGLDIPDSAWRWDVICGVVLEHLDLENFTFNYELIGGANVGATGVLDHSGNSDFIYYVIGVQAKKNFADHYVMIPRFIWGKPRSNDDFTTRLTGPGFELTTASTGAGPGNIGDQFGYVGMTVRDTQSRFEMDVGAILGYAMFEYLAHEGVDLALIVSLTWRM